MGITSGIPAIGSILGAWDTLRDNERRREAAKQALENTAENDHELQFGQVNVQVYNINFSSSTAL